MNKFKDQLDKMMGDTDLQEKQIKKRVHEIDGDVKCSG